MDLSPQTAFRPYQADVLFLLVGGNPLPNYVAALLLARDDSVIYLLHTEGPKNTLEVAKRLERALREKKPSAEIILRGIDEADGARIVAKTATIIAEIKQGKAVGLNYTGGTKPMAVHVYHALKEKSPDGCCFSYLDARSLKMFINHDDEPTQRLPVARVVELSLEELLALHGYTLREPPRKSAKQLELCRAIAQVHSTPHGFKQWRAWTLELGGDSPSLPSSNEYPALKPVTQAFADMCGSQAPTEAEVAHALQFTELKQCSKFFIGDWLEEYTVDAVRQVSGDLGIVHYGIDMHPKKVDRKRADPDWNLDVAAMCGYQLFAISCVATEEAKEKDGATKPGRAKEHLFEVFVRARQVGGDEARFGLISCVRDPIILKQEVEQAWDAEGKISVFGQRDLPNLADHLKEWFETANKE